MEGSAWTPLTRGVPNRISGIEAAVRDILPTDAADERGNDIMEGVEGLRAQGRVAGMVG